MNQTTRKGYLPESSRSSQKLIVWARLLSPLIKSERFTRPPVWVEHRREEFRIKFIHVWICKNRDRITSDRDTIHLFIEFAVNNEDNNPGAQTDESNKVIDRNRHLLMRKFFLSRKSSTSSTATSNKESTLNLTSFWPRVGKFPTLFMKSIGYLIWQSEKWWSAGS